MDAEAAAAAMDLKVFAKVEPELPMDKKDELPVISASSSSRTDDVASTGRRKVFRTMWDEYCNDMDYASWIAPVHYFKNAPLADRWLDMAKLGMVVELPNPNSIRKNLDNLALWFGEIVAFAGYRALIEFLPVSDADKSKPKYVWLAFCSDLPRHVGFGCEKGIPLVPIQEGKLGQSEIVEIHNIMKSKPTVALNHCQLLCEELGVKARKYTLGSIVEAVDKDDCSRYRFATVMHMVGDRVHVLYCDKMNTPDPGYWFNQASPFIHSLGWSNTVGTELYGVHLNNNLDRFLTVDPSTLPTTPPGVKIERGMLFEMIHPILPHKIVPGFVANPLRHGYLAALTDWTRLDELAEIVFHITYDDILPLNFCRDHGVRMDPPTDGVTQNNKFSWKKYLAAKREFSALNLNAIKRPPNPFIKGCKLEAVNVIEPKFIRPATVTTVAGHLIRIHFDGMERTNPKAFQWVSCASPDIYPAGYAEMVGDKTIGSPVAPLICDMIQKKPSSSRRQN